MCCRLVVVGQRRAVSVEQSVGALVAVHLEAAMRRGEHTLLIAIRIAALRLEGHALVHPFPHAAACERRCLLDDLPLAVVVLKGDAEGVEVLGEDDRAVGTLIEAAHLPCCGIVRCIDVGHRGEVLEVVGAEGAALLRIADVARGVELLDILAKTYTGSWGRGFRCPGSISAPRDSSCGGRW